MPVAEITCVRQDLVIEVSIEAQHIDRVHTGQLSRVKFVFFKSILVLWFLYRLILPILFLLMQKEKQVGRHVSLV